MKRQMLCAVAVLSAAIAVGAQAPAFDVASVKTSNPNPTGPLGAVPMILPALGRLTATNVTLRLLVIGAYQKQPYQIVGGPPWQNADKFDINAKSEDGSMPTDQILERLKTLLADRFKLRVHTETREAPIYNLVVARGDGKLGEKLKPSSENCPGLKEQQQKQLEALAKGGLSALASLQQGASQNPACGITPLPAEPGSIGIKARGQAMSTLTLLLTQLVGRPVVDRTGLAGLYDFEFRIDMQTLLRIYADLGVNVPAPQGLPEGPSLMTELQEGLGLKLDSARGPTEVLVIDSAEKPTAD